MLAKKLAGFFVFLTFPGTFVSAATFQLGEATIADMQQAMNDSGISSVEISALYLNRIFVYDRGPRALLAVPQINPTLFTDAARADRRRAGGQRIGTLEGIPVVLKDSYDVAGLASSAGAAPLKHLIGKTDAAVVTALKNAGAIILGKSNMWPFAYGIAYDPNSRYAWGRGISPYTREQDFGGSSTGSATAAAANLCAFAMGGDTGSSIRLPSARTALVGGRPSLFLLPGSGIIPDEVTLDVIGPMTRTVTDNAIAMDAVVVDDPHPLDTGFFPPASKVRPKTYTSRLKKNALRGKVIGLPKPYIGKDPDAHPLEPAIQSIWDVAVAKLKSCGATVKEIDWPFYHHFNDSLARTSTYYQTVGLSDSQFRNQWEWVDAYYFNEQIKGYQYPRVRDVFGLPAPDGTEDPGGHDTIGKFQKYVRQGLARPYAFYDFASYFAAYRRWAKRDVENVMEAAGVDLLAFPVTGGDSENIQNYEFLNAVNEGSFLGLPQLSVPMGFAPSGRPQGMMLMARSYYSEAEILGYAYAFEQATHSRRPPAGTPPLPGETIDYIPRPATQRPEIDPPNISIRPFIRHANAKAAYRIEGTTSDASGLRSVRIFLNGRLVATRSTPGWVARVPAPRFRKLTRGYKALPFVMVLASDTYKNTSARAAWLHVQAVGP